MRKKDIFEENKELQSSLFLAQSYQDAWADYGRSLKKERFNSLYSMISSDNPKAAITENGCPLEILGVLIWILVNKRRGFHLCCVRQKKEKN